MSHRADNQPAGASGAMPTASVGEHVLRPEDADLVAALRRGEEEAFRRLVTQYHAGMLRVALMYVSSREVAAEVIQQTWLGVLQGLARFEGRSSLKSWIYRILVNIAKTHGAREARSVPFSSLANAALQDDEPAVEPERFIGEGQPYAGHWVSKPRDWDTVPEERLLSGEMRAEVARAIGSLPLAQRQVITLRDVEGCSSAEVCELLGLTEGNQRVLLHRARSKVRHALDVYLGEG